MGKFILPLTVTELFEQFHRIPLSASGIRKRELMYKEKIIGNDAIIKLKFEFDKWCSIWFWPIDKLDLIPTPRTFKNLSLETTQEIKNIAKEQKFFHWELEFPDVFAVRQSGFDAIITNPPWNIEKPNSVEFFSYYDPLYSTYGKQEAVRQQNRLYQENSEIEYEWLKNNLNNKAMSNWVKNSYNPFGYDEKCNNIVTLTNKKTENRSLHQSWALKRNNDRVNKREMLPFYLQGGSDINLYKLFVEESCYLINKNGRLAMIVPSGIYSDKGTKELRKYFLNNFNWEWVFSFENRNRIFDIHGSFKFSIIILQKNKKFEYIKTAFMVRDIEAWQKLNIDILKYYKTSIIKFSPNNMALLEFEHQKDIDIINKIYNSEKQEIDINTSREFDMTNDSKLFKTQVELIDKEYRTDKFGRMIKGNDVYYPLYQGTMINQLNFADKKWSVENEKWEKNDNMKIISSQYYINKNYSEFKYKLKFQYRSISNATNNRTLIGAITPYYPSGNSLNKVIIEGDDSKYILLGGIMSSFVYDYILRNKMIGTNLNSFILKEIPLTKIDNNIQDNFLMMCASLQLNHYIFAPQWIELRQKMKGLNTKCLYKLWAVSNHERMRLRAIVEAIVAYSYGVSFEDLDYILRDDESNAKGFWRVDKEKPKEVRLTTLSLEAYKDLLDRGINEFINDEWQLPKVAADYYGTQYLEWQLEKTAEESWQDCEQYAKEFLGEDEFEKFMSDLKEMEMK